MLLKKYISDRKLWLKVRKKFTYERAQASKGKLWLSYVLWLAVACLPPSNILSSNTALQVLQLTTMLLAELVEAGEKYV